MKRLDEHRPTSGVIEGDGVLKVRFHEPKARSGVQTLDLKRWISRKELAKAIAFHLEDVGMRKGRGTRSGLLKRLDVFRRYLAHRESSGEPPVESLADITTTLIDGYENWLNAQVSEAKSEEEPKRWSDNTKAQRYNTILGLVQWCRETPRFSNDIRDDLRFNNNPWPKRHHKVKSHDPLSLLDLTAIRKACTKEIQATLKALRTGQEILEDVVELPGVGASAADYRDFRICLATIAHLYPDGVPTRIEIAQTRPGLARALGDPYHSMEKVVRHLYFTSRTLVPFAVMLAIDTIFNPSTILTLKWDDIDKSHPIFGEDRWRISGEKPKAGSRQRKSFPARVNSHDAVVVLLKHLEKFSDQYRKYLPLIHRGRVFAFWHMTNKCFASFDDEGGASGDKTWRYALDAFIRENRLPKFTLVTLRATGSDVINIMARGDIKTQQAALSHASAATTDRHYQSGAAKRRGRESLADAMALRERYIATGGKSDTRNGGLGEGLGTAATPGFGCLEPRHSPQPGQRAGKLCTAFGACPTCALAWINSREPRGLVRLAQLKERISEARTLLHPQRWLEEWQPRLTAIDEVWIPKFSPTVASAARSITLPPIPSIE